MFKSYIVPVTKLETVYLHQIVMNVKAEELFDNSDRSKLIGEYRSIGAIADIQFDCEFSGTTQRISFYYEAQAKEFLSRWEGQS